MSDISSSACEGDSVDETADELKALILENACLRDETVHLRKMIVSLQKKQLVCFTPKYPPKTTTQSVCPSKQPKPNQEEAPKDPVKIQQCQQIVGEIAFQLDHRILSAVFSEEQRLYGYRVADIEKKIEQVTTCVLTEQVDDELRCELYHRYHSTINPLKELGYNPTVHTYYTEYLVNTYGIMNEQEVKNEKRFTADDLQFLSKMITENMPGEKVEDILVLLNCLVYFVRNEGEGAFLW